jgi:hypothetical protein
MSSLKQYEELYEEFPIVPQPKRINLPLYRHQLTSIYNMEKLEANCRIKICNLEELNTRIGILSDLTGYGKTFSILGLIERDEMKISIEYPFVITSVQGNPLINKQKVSLYTVINSNLIVLNQSLLNQWEIEIRKTGISYYLINSKKAVDEVKPNEYEIILCNCTMYPYLISRFRKWCWKRLILDEPLTLKLIDFNNFAFGFIWLITATPYEIIMQPKNNYIYPELFSKNEDLLQAVILRNPDEYVRKSFQMPESIHQYHSSYDPIGKILEGIVSPVLHEMIIAGNIKEAIRYLGGTSTSESLFYLVKDKKMKKISELDNQILNLEPEDVDSLKKLKEKKENILKQVNQMIERLNLEINSECIICNGENKKPIFLPCCQNLICSECILTWICNKPNCPLCRNEIKKDDLVIITDKKEDKDYVQTLKTGKKITKPQIISELIKSKEGSKFIIFSNFDESFLPVKLILDEEKISYCEIKGGKDIRAKNLASFKNNEVSVLFLNSKNNAAGINLQETTDIILYHNMSDYCETQILGRANRIGRTQPLFVHHLI